MRIVFFTHPDFINSQSMPRFARYLAEGMHSRGHKVETWTPVPRLHKFTLLPSLRKWLGYVDQYIIFPQEVKKRLTACPQDTLFVFTDQALGPWIPLVAERPHIIHCHDFLAQHSALGNIQENPTGWTGSIYQSIIRRGYRKGEHFISVSQTTREQLDYFLTIPPKRSEVVYNGLNQLYVLHDVTEARSILSQKLGLDLSAGYLLHVGGNQWYKNRLGVIQLYNAWRYSSISKIPLLLVGEKPDKLLLDMCEESAFKSNIHLVDGLEDYSLHLAYAGATAFLFPSLAEGFGWPIAEAMAAGCPVITTGEPPMTEVGGNAAFYIPRRLANQDPVAWATNGAQIIQQVVELVPSERQTIIEAGLANANRFDHNTALDSIEAIYQSVLHTYAHV